MLIFGYLLSTNGYLYLNPLYFLLIIGWLLLRIEIANYSADRHLTLYPLKSPHNSY